MDLPPTPGAPGRAGGGGGGPFGFLGLNAASRRGLTQLQAMIAYAIIEDILFSVAGHFQ
jgi:hypothetical protein